MLFGQPGQKARPAEDAPKNPPSFDKMDLIIGGIDIQLRKYQQEQQIIEADRSRSDEWKSKKLAAIQAEEQNKRPQLADKMLDAADRIVNDLQSTLRTKRLFAKARALEDAPPGEVREIQEGLKGGLLQNYNNVGELATAYDTGSAAFKRALQTVPAAIDARWTGPQYQRDKDRLKERLKQDYRAQDPEVEAVAEELSAFKMVYSSRTRHMLDSLIPPSVMFSAREYHQRWNDIFGEDLAEGYTQGLFG